MEQRFIETIKVMDGGFCNLGLQMDRIRRVSERFFGKHTPIDLDNLIIPEEFRQGIVKCRIIYGAEIYAITFNPYLMRNIRNVALVKDNTINYAYKYEDRSRLNLLFNLRGNCDDILIVKNGMVTDTSFGNVVLKSGDGLFFTPSTPLLPGTKRATLLSKKQIIERKISSKDIYSYEGFYIINAMIDLEDNVFIENSNISQSL